MDTPFTETPHSSEPKWYPTFWVFSRNRTSKAAVASYVYGNIILRICILLEIATVITTSSFFFPIYERATASHINHKGCTFRGGTESANPTHPRAHHSGQKHRHLCAGAGSTDSKYTEIGPLKMTRIKYQKKNLGLILLLELLREYGWGGLQR